MDLTSLLGAAVTCAVTHKSFVVARDGCTFNCATRNGGAEIVSDEGVNACEVDGLRNRTEPFYAYVSADGKRVTGWKGNVLGTIVSRSTGRLARWSYVHGKTINFYRVRDCHGAFWAGRGSPGISIKLRAVKA